MVEPARCARRVRKRNRDRAAQLVADADALRDALDAEQPARRKAADADDELRPCQLELPVAPERAQILLARRRRAVAAAARRRPGIAPRHGRAVEGRVEG